jgi:hypothetical protein
MNSLNKNSMIKINELKMLENWKIVLKNIDKDIDKNIENPTY